MNKEKLTFSFKLDDLKWQSIKCAPSSNFLKLLKPKWRDIDKPIADHKEYLPPTQSQKTNIFFSSIPNSFTFSVFVDKATKCFAIAEI